MPHWLVECINMDQYHQSLGSKVLLFDLGAKHCAKIARLPTSTSFVNRPPELLKGRQDPKEKSCIELHSITSCSHFDYTEPRAGSKVANFRSVRTSMDLCQSPETAWNGHTHDRTWYSMPMCAASVLLLTGKVQPQIGPAPSQALRRELKVTRFGVKRLRVTGSKEVANLKRSIKGHGPDLCQTLTASESSCQVVRQKLPSRWPQHHKSIIKAFGLRHWYRSSGRNDAACNERPRPQAVMTFHDGWHATTNSLGQKMS